MEIRQAGSWVVLAEAAGWRRDWTKCPACSGPPAFLLRTSIDRWKGSSSPCAMSMQLRLSTLCACVRVGAPLCAFM